MTLPDHAVLRMTVSRAATLRKLTWQGTLGGLEELQEAISQHKARASVIQLQGNEFCNHLNELGNRFFLI